MPLQEPIPRAIRLVQIQNLLYRNPRGLTSSELAVACGVSVRTIERDIADLGCPPYNIPVLADGRRYTLAVDYQPLLSMLRLSLPEATALFLAARLLQRSSDEHNPYVTSALARLAAALPDAIGDHVRRTLVSAAQEPTNDPYVCVFATITQGWAMRHAVRLWHQSGRSRNVHEYLLHPYFIEPSAPSFAAYVIGYEDLYFHRINTFKLERVQRAELMEQTFTVPASFDITAFLSSAWGIMGGGPAVDVVLRFTPDATRRVKESVWHPLQEIEDMPDGGCHMRVPVSQPIEMLPWIRGWAHNVEVLAPEDLRARVAEEARQTADVYGGGGSNG